MVHGEVMNGAIEPGTGLFDGVKMGVKSHEGFLDEVLGDVDILDQLVSVTEEGGLEFGEQLFQRTFCPHGTGFRWIRHSHYTVYDTAAENSLD